MSIEAVRGMIAAGVALRRNPASRFSFVRDEGALVLFVDGEAIEYSADESAFSERLCAQETMVVGPDLAASNAVVGLIANLLNKGSIAFD